MDEIPDRLLDAVGDEPVIETVDLGGGDAVVVTPAQTYLYRSDGLLSDESIETFSHDVERFAVESGRRKASLRLESIDGERGFTVPGEAVDAVVEAILEGVLRTTGVVEPDESVRAQFRFSDLTLVVTDAKLFKHVGPAVWNEDFEMFDYESLTDLDFEEGSVATQVVVEMGGRQNRVKVPNEQAGRVRREIQSAIFEYHGVSSLGGLREKIAVEEPESGSSPATDVTEPAPDVERSDTDTDTGSSWSPPADQDVTGPRGKPDPTPETPPAAVGDQSLDESTGDEDGADLERLEARLDDLEAQLKRQNELLESQQETIRQLVEELRRGR